MWKTDKYPQPQNIDALNDYYALKTHNALKHGEAPSLHWVEEDTD